MTTDWVPVDVPINLSIAAAWKIGTQPSTTIPVYNCTSGTINPLTWGQVVTYLVASLRKYPMENALWYPGLSHWEYAWVNWICQVDCWVIFSFITNISLGLGSLHPCIHLGHVRLLDGEQASHEDGGPEDAQGIKGIKLCLLLK